MYFPQHRPQLTGRPTQSVDCGVRATQMGLDAITKGEVIRSVPTIRDIGNMGDGPTNYYEWDEVFDELGGRTMGFSGEKTNDWNKTKSHIRNEGWAILAVHYGTYRKSMQAKSGSLSFNGYHAILFGADRKRSGRRETRSFDSLLDGRYRGCPDGPVWVPQWKVRNAAMKVGQMQIGTDAVYALLLHPDVVVEPGDPGAPLPVPPEFMSIPDILSDLVEAQEMADQEVVRQRIENSVDGLRVLLGIHGNPEADEDTDVDAGITVTE